MSGEDEVAARLKHAAHLAQNLESALPRGDAHEPLGGEQRSIEALIGIGQGRGVSNVEPCGEAALLGCAAGRLDHRVGQVEAGDATVAGLVETKRSAACAAADVEYRAVPWHVPVNQPTLRLPRPDSGHGIDIVPGMVRILPRLSDERLVDWLLNHWMLPFGCSPSPSHKKRPPHFGKALDGAICKYLAPTSSP